MSRTSEAPNALVSSEQIRSKQTSETLLLKASVCAQYVPCASCCLVSQRACFKGVLWANKLLLCTDGRVPDEIREKVPDKRFYNNILVPM